VRRVYADADADRHDHPDVHAHGDADNHADPDPNADDPGSARLLSDANACGPLINEQYWRRRAGVWRVV
jgi:hypothetical protein